MARRMVLLACTLLPFAMAAGAQQLTPAEEGRRLFLANNCYVCHGGRAGGGSFGAPEFRSEAPERGDLSEAIREGEDRGMPPFPKLNNATDINNLYAYLQSLRRPSEPKFNLWWEPLPLANARPLTPRVYVVSREKDVVARRAGKGS